MNDEVIRLLLQITGARDLDEARAAVDRLRGKLEEFGGASDAAGKSSQAMNQRILEAGRAFQDFMQGGVGGILNNIERIVGGAGPMAGILTAVGTAAYFAVPAIKGFLAALADGSNKVPESADALGRLNGELKANAKALDELKDKQSLTNKEVAEFNRLSERQVELEKEINDEKERRRRAEEVAKLKPFGVKEQEGERSEAMKALLGDEKDRKATIDAMVKAIEAEFDAANKEKGPERFRAIAGLMTREGGLRAPGESHEDQVRRAATNMLNRAITGGNEQDIRNITRFLPGGGMRRDIEESTLPENLRRQDRELEDEGAPGTEAFGRRLHGAGEGRRKAARKAEELNREGQRNADATRALQDREKEKARQELLQRERAQKQAVAQDQRLGREVGQRFAKQGPLAAIPDGQLIHATPMQPGPLNAQMAMEIARNQEILAQNQAADLEALRRLKAVGRESREQNQQRKKPASNKGW